MPDSTAGLILNAWLRNANRKLSRDQRDVIMNAFKQCPLPLYLKLSFDEATRWKSYQPIEQCILQDTIKESINSLLARLERLHGYLLVSRGLGYITAAKYGLSDAELDDILSLDDEVLNDVYQYWTPPVRRIPPLLWIRVKTDLGAYIVSRGVDGTFVNKCVNSIRTHIFCKSGSCLEFVGISGFARYRIFNSVAAQMLIFPCHLKKFKFTSLARP